MSKEQAIHVGRMLKRADAERFWHRIKPVKAKRGWQIELWVTPMLCRIVDTPLDAFFCRKWFDEFERQYNQKRAELLGA